jgi:hypothetical protein
LIINPTYRQKKPANAVVAIMRVEKKATKNVIVFFPELPFGTDENGYVLCKAFNATTGTWFGAHYKQWLSRTETADEEQRNQADAALLLSGFTSPMWWVIATNHMHPRNLIANWNEEQRRSQAKGE